MNGKTDSKRSCLPGIHGFPGKSYTPHPIASAVWLPYIVDITTPEVTR